MINYIYMTGTLIVLRITTRKRERKLIDLNEILKLNYRFSYICGTFEDTEICKQVKRLLQKLRFESNVFKNIPRRTLKSSI